jgi:hypothetical protein
VFGIRGLLVGSGLCGGSALSQENKPLYKAGVDNWVRNILISQHTKEDVLLGK